MKKDEKQPESSGVQPGQTPDETPQESGAQTAEAPGEETAPAKETEAQAEEPAPGQEDSCEDPGEEPQEDSEDFDPENGEYPDEEYDWEEDAPLSFGARLFSASVFDQRPGNERNPPGHKFGIVNQRRDGIFGNVDPESLFTPLYGDVGSLIEHDALVDL